LNSTNNALIDASSGGSLANKTPEEAWQLIADVADANQHFKTRATTSKSLFEISSSESTLTKTLGEMASILKEIRQGQQATSNVQRKHPPSQLEPPKYCVICSYNTHYTDEVERQSIFFVEPTTRCQTYQNQQPSYTYNRPQNFQNQNPPYQQSYQSPNQQRYQPPHIRQNIPNHQTPPPQSTIKEALQPLYQENKEFRNSQRRTETPLSTITDLLTRVTIQPTINNPNTSQPSTSSGIPSQTPPNPKGSLNAISLSFEDTPFTVTASSLYDASLMKFIVSLEDNHENEIMEMEVQKEAMKDECVTEVEDQITTPSPKLIYEVVNIPQDIAISSLLTLLDLIDNVSEKFGVCISIMLLEVYRKLNLGSLNESSNRYALADKSITLMIGVAENVLLRIKNLTFLIDFHILDMPSNLEDHPPDDIVEFRLSDAIEDILSEHSIFWCDVIKDVEVKDLPKVDEKCLKVANHESPFQAKKLSRRRKKLKKKAKRSQEASVKKKATTSKESLVVNKTLKQSMCDRPT
ncbi:hypothetical protein PIB30_082044, partial [Stylosanthes scabra]|nr:hypothetical protein [Stylosanthes scabra]